MKHQGIDLSAALRILAAGNVQLRAQPGTSAYGQEIVDALVEFSSIDALTGLCNRRRMDSELERCLQLVARGRPCTLMAMDLDHFKRINDQYGHTVGDRVLREVADILRKMTRSSEVVSRMGGEEFGVLLEGVTSQDALLIAERMLEAIRKGVTAAPGVTASVGLVMLGGGAFETPEGWWERADICLYAAKNRGRDRVVVEKARKRGCR